MNIKNYRTNKDSLPTPPSTPGESEGGCDNSGRSDELDMLVLDADGRDWMSKWKRLFKTFNMDYLRSPMFFHVDPADRDALLGYEYEKKNGEKDLLALPGCAGKDISKHRKKKKLSAKGRFLGRTPDVDERDRKDYYTPSTDLFDCHCAEVVHRYGLSRDMVRHERVTDIGYDDISTLGDVEHDSVISDDALENDMKIFRIKREHGVHYAHVVVLAVGPGNAPTIPAVPGLPNVSTHEGFAHALHIKQFPPSYVTTKVKGHRPTNIVIVGGGLIVVV